jgi:VanZ family protein
MTACMRHDIPGLPGRWHLAGLCLLYGAAMLYSSTLIGPAGIHFVPRDPVDAWRWFLATPYVDHGSDQRADWIGNLLMLVPFGFLVGGSLWPRRRVLRPLAALAALAICVGVILAIKYLQLFFPPRTVTLNYILAQTLGSAIGCACWVAWHNYIGAASGRGDYVWALVLGLRLYAAALCLFVLMPLDFALDASDLHRQLARLPQTLLALPGHDRPPLVRAVLVAMAAVAFVPVGMLLSFVRNGDYRVRRGLAAVAWRGVVLTSGLYCLAVLVISAFPVAPSILYRTVGVIAGAASISWLVRQDANALLQRLERWTWWTVLPYLGGVLLVNRLLSVDFLSWQEAAAQAYPLGFLPLFDYYIVTKAEAAKNIAAHFALYMPVGPMLWLRNRDTGPAQAFAVAAILSSMVELGRYFRPGLQADVNAVVVAGVASVLALWLMPRGWSMLLALQRHSGAEAGKLPRPELVPLVGEVEHY